MVVVVVVVVVVVLGRWTGWVGDGLPSFCLHTANNNWRAHVGVVVIVIVVVAAVENVRGIPPPATNPHPSTHIHAKPLARTGITNAFRQLQSRSATSTYLTLCVAGGLKSFQLTWTGAAAAAAGGGESTSTTG